MILLRSCVCVGGITRWDRAEHRLLERCHSAKQFDVLRKAGAGVYGVVFAVGALVQSPLLLWCQRGLLCTFAILQDTCSPWLACARDGILLLFRLGATSPGIPVQTPCTPSRWPTTRTETAPTPSTNGSWYAV